MEEEEEEEACNMKDQEKNKATYHEFHFFLEQAAEPSTIFRP